MDQDLVKLIQNSIFEIAIKDGVKQLKKENYYTFNAIFDLANAALNNIQAQYPQGTDGIKFLPKDDNEIFHAIFDRIRFCLHFGLEDCSNSMLLLGKHKNVWLFDFELRAIQQASSQSEMYIDAISDVKLIRQTKAIESGYYDIEIGDEDIDINSDTDAVEKCSDIVTDDFDLIRRLIAQREHHTITW